MRGGFAVLVTLLLSAPTSTALAQTPSSPAATSVAARPRSSARAYSFHPIADPVAISLAATVWLGPELFLSQLVHPSCPCNPDELIPLDRLVAGRRNDTISRIA